MLMLKVSIDNFEHKKQYAPVSQLDRVHGYEPCCREFESLRVHQEGIIRIPILLGSDYFLLMIVLLLDFI